MFATRKVKSADGLDLAVRIYEPDAVFHGLPLVCLAGLTRNGRDFHEIATLLSQSTDNPRRVVTIDSRGRGDSDRDPDKSRYTVPVEAADAITVLDALGIQKADFIGTSRGGLILHVLASMAPDRLGKLIFNDIGPVIELEGMRHIQSYLDPAPCAQSRSEVLAGLKAVHGAGFPALSDGDWDDMVDALYRPADASPDTHGSGEAPKLLIPDFDPAIAEAVKAMDLSAPLPDLWPLFDLLKSKPVMVVRGENSALLSIDTVAEMTTRHPGLRLAIAKGQGHAPLLHLGDLPPRIGTFLIQA